MFYYNSAQSVDVVISVSPERARNGNKGGKEKVIISLEAKPQT